MVTHPSTNHDRKDFSERATEPLSIGQLRHWHILLPRTTYSNYNVFVNAPYFDDFDAWSQEERLIFFGGHPAKYTGFYPLCVLRMKVLMCDSMYSFVRYRVSWPFLVTRQLVFTRLSLLSLRLTVNSCNATQTVLCPNVLEDKIRDIGFHSSLNDRLCLLVANNLTDLKRIEALVELFAH